MTQQQMGDQLPSKPPETTTTVDTSQENPTRGCEAISKVTETNQIPPQPSAQASISTLELILQKVGLKKIYQQFRAFAPWLWAIVLVVVILPKIGELFIAKAFETPMANQSSPTSLIPGKPPVDWSDVDKQMVAALRDAHQKAEAFGAEKVQNWANDLTERIDNSFLDWYFGYFNQKQLEYEGFFAGVTANMARWLNPNSQAPEERISEVITEEFQMEFAKRVLRPQLSQLQLERITEKTVSYYLQELRLNISQIPIQRNIPQADWETYLDQLSMFAKDANGTSVSLPIKLLLAKTAFTTVKPIIAPLLPVVGSKVAVILGGKLGAKIAAKSGAVLAGKLGSTFLDATVGVGIILWDIWDVHHTTSIEKPILRDSLVDYLDTLSGSLLNNPETGIMSVVNHLEDQILQGLRNVETITSNF